MIILLPTHFLQRGVILSFISSLERTTDEVDNSWCLSSHGEFLGVLSSNFAIFQSTQRSPTSQLWDIADSCCKPEKMVDGTRCINRKIIK